jgi:methionine synthase I (cobalamin-dependent)
MASKPANPKLWATIVAMARAKYSNYPNPGASAWVHKRYVQAGGQFVESTESDRRKKMAQKKHEHEQEKKRLTKKEEKKSSKKDKGKK